MDRVVEAVEEILKGNVVVMLEKKTLPKLDLPKVCGVCGGVVCVCVLDVCIGCVWGV